MLIDVQAVLAWRQLQVAPCAEVEDVRADLTARLPELLGRAIDEAVRLTPHKRDSQGLAFAAVATWVLATELLFDELGVAPRRQPYPAEIERLLKIATG